MKTPYDVQQAMQACNLRDVYLDLLTTVADVLLLLPKDGNR
jgi:hypothetical protein